MTIWVIEIVLTTGALERREAAGNLSEILASYDDDGIMSIKCEPKRVVADQQIDLPLRAA